MANEKNLKPCKKGETHNPYGKPKGTKNWKTIYKEIMELEMKAKDSGFDIPFIKDQNQKMTVRRMIALRQIKKALGKCDAVDIKLLQDREEGSSDINIKQNINSVETISEKQMKEIESELLEIIKKDLK